MSWLEYWFKEDIMARKFVDLENEAYIWEKTKNTFVSKEAGKGLSEANFTQAEKAKLENIAAGAEVNVNADWNASTGDAAILNKPANLVQDASYVHTDSNYTAAEKTKLNGIAAGAEVNVQANWNETDSTSDAYIANKPTIDTVMSNSSNNAIANRIVKEYIDQAIGGITGIDFQIVDSLPSTGVKGTIYMVSNGGSAQNTYDEYIWVVVNEVGKFEKIGTTDIDLSNYMQFSDMTALTTAEIDTICV